MQSVVDSRHEPVGSSGAGHGQREPHPLVFLCHDHPPPKLGRVIHSQPASQLQLSGHAAVVVLVVVVVPPSVVVLVEAQPAGGSDSASAQYVQVQSPMSESIVRQKAGYWQRQFPPPVVVLVVVVVVVASTKRQQGSFGLQVVVVVVVVVPPAVVVLVDVVVVTSAQLFVSSSQISPFHTHLQRPAQSLAVVVLVVEPCDDVGGVMNSNRLESGIGPATQAIG